MNKRIKNLILIVAFLSLIVGCSKKEKIDTYDIGVVSDNKIDNDSKLLAINNTLANMGDKITFLTSKAGSLNQYISKAETFINKKYDLIITISFLQNTAVETLASQNEGVKFLAIDAIIDPVLDNVVSLNYKTNESTFLLGYIAGLSSKSNKLAYVGPKSNILSDYEEYGFKAGALTAARELKKPISIQIEYVDQFNDRALGKELADKIYGSGVDIIYENVGETGLGILDAAKSSNKLLLVYGPDKLSLDKEHILAAGINNYSTLLEDLVKSIMSDQLVGEKLNLGIKEGAVSISEFQEEGILAKEIYKRALALEEKIRQEQIKVPFDLESYEEFAKN